MQLKDSIALVTGANGGIGKQFVEKLGAEGAAKIYVCARNPAKLTDLVGLAADRIIPVQLEVTDAQSVQAAAATCQDVTLVINNAGISRNQGFISAANLEDARAEMEVNYFGLMSMCQAFAPILQQNGGGAIINVASLLGKINLPFSGSYSATKAAVISLSQCVRAELAAQGTLVITVMPGTVNTDLAKDWPDPKVSPAEVARAALQAVVDRLEDVYPGEQATQIATQLLQDPKGVEQYMAKFLPGMRLAGTTA